MFVKSYKVIKQGVAAAEIYASTVPSSFPYDTIGMDGIDGGYRLAPSSTLYITTTGDIYMLGTNDDWTKQ